MPIYVCWGVRTNHLLIRNKQTHSYGNHQVDRGQLYIKIAKQNFLICCCPLSWHRTKLLLHILDSNQLTITRFSILSTVTR